ncbi:MAG TPA: hypothetical protein VIS76_03510 [Pseudomonadales bacterium]
MSATRYDLDATIWNRRVALFCLGGSAMVGVLDLTLYHWALQPSEIIGQSFNIGEEQSLGTWVSTFLALFTGLVAAGIAASSRLRSGLNSVTLGWVVVALFFLFISFDDTARFHERAGTAMRVKVEALTETPLQTWFPSWGWQIYVMPVFAAVGAYLAWFFWRELPPSRRVFAYLGFALFATAVSIDFVEGVLDRRGVEINHLMRLVEELLEMVGTTAFLYAFLQTLGDRVRMTIFLQNHSADA